MNSKSLTLILSAVLAAACSAAATADEQRVTIDGNAAAGVRYDSNVALVELDAKSGEADTATVLEAGIGLRIALTEHTVLRTGYNYSGTSYRQFSAYDLALHRVFAEATVKSRLVDAALGADHFTGVLDGERYLELTQVSPSVSRLFAGRVFVRGAYIAASKDYEQTASRDADSRALRLDTYFLLDGMQRHISLSLQKSSEEAVDAALSYDGMQAAIGYGRTFELPLMQLQVKALLKYEQRDYLAGTEPDNVARRDRRLRSSVTMSIPFNDHVRLEGLLEHTDNSSTLDSATIKKFVYGLGLAVRF